jgi:hypothetical protein
MNYTKRPTLLLWFEYSLKIVKIILRLTVKVKIVANFIVNKG